MTDGTDKASAGRDRRRLLGTFAENIAAAHLERRGYLIRARNVHLRVGEIDIVAEQAGMTVFVEVRARHQGDLGSALASFSRAKRHRMVLAAGQYLARHPEAPQEARIDVVAVALDRTGRVVEITVVENAVEGDE